MITSREQAAAVQKRRRESGKKGRSKAVRRWFKRSYGHAVEEHDPSTLPDGLWEEIKGDFSSCRSFDETYLTK